MYFKKGLKLACFFCSWKKKAICELWEKSFAVIPYMRNHVARIHKGEQHGICKICEYICSSKYTWNKSILNLFMKKSHFSVKCVNETSHGVFIWRIMLPEFKRKLLDVHSAAMDVLLKRTWMGLLRAFMTKRSLTNVNFAKKVQNKGHVLRVYQEPWSFLALILAI